MHFPNGQNDTYYVCFTQRRKISVFKTSVYICGGLCVGPCCSLGPHAYLHRLITVAWEGEASTLFWSPAELF